MMLATRSTRLWLLVILALASLVPAHAQWARWLGPDQDGTVSADGLLSRGTIGLEVAWKRPLGIGYSGIAIAGGKAVTLFADGETDWLTAVNAGTGEEIWRYRIDSMYAGHDGSEGGASSMPVIDGGVVFGLGAKGHLFAVRLEDGAEIWSQRIDERYGARPPRYGFATTPLVAGDVLFVQIGGDDGRSLAGFDRKTGELLWSTGDDAIGYQSPVLATLLGQEQILAVTNRRLLGLAPKTGRILWSVDHGISPGEGEDGYATPLLLGQDHLLLTGQEISKAFAVRQTASGPAATELWSSTALKQSLATPVLHDGHLYGFSGEFLTCVDASTGEKVWKSRPPGGRGVILIDGRLVIFANDGSLVVAEASPDGYREVARVAVSERGAYTYPSFAGGTIFVRNTLDAAAVTVKQAAPAAPDEGSAVARNDFERFVRKVDGARDKRLLIDDFMASQSGFPVLEGDRWVHFLYRGDVEDVAITGSMTEYLAEEGLQRIEGTDLFYRSYAVESGDRWEYRFNVDFENPQPDPLNPRRVAGMDGDVSEMVTAAWQEPDYLRPYEGDRAGRIETFRLASEVLGNERDIDVYLPGGYDQGSERYPVLVISNGKEWQENAHLPNTMDQLVGRQIAPVVVVLVEMLEDVSRDEIGGSRSDDYVRMLADELVPEVDRRYRTRAAAGDRALLGLGGNALMSVYAVLQRPDVFGMAGGCSFYLPNPGGTLLFDAIEAGAGRDGARLWVLWNDNDLRRAEWDLDLKRDSQRVAEALQAAGYDLVRREADDSAGWGSWRVRMAEILVEMFPRR